MTRPDFVPFPKLARLNRTVTATEKIDGTNAQIVITEDGEIYAGSRTRWITPSDDNAGFAKWVLEHKDELIAGLGIGQHFGEWYGTGIQRRYGLTEKRFALFNAHRWTDDVRPSCCHVVPILAVGTNVDDVQKRALDILRIEGSRAVPGFLDPEGIVLYHSASKQSFKVTLKNDDKPKGSKEE